MFPLQVVKLIRLTFFIIKLHLSAALQYRANFILQVLSMFINDAALTIIWIIFFKQFPSINGWTFNDTALLLGIAWASFFIVNFFFAGVFYINEIIITGNLDQFLLLPKPLIWQIATSKSEYIEIGSFIVSLYLLYSSEYVTIANLPLLILLLIISAIIDFNFLLIIGTLSFYFGNLAYAKEKLIQTLFDLIYFPQTAFTGIIRFIMIFILPVFFLATIPMQLIKEFNLIWFFILISFTIVQTIFAFWFFNKGLQKYESGI